MWLAFFTATTASSTPSPSTSPSAEELEGLRHDDVRDVVAVHVAHAESARVPFGVVRERRAEGAVARAGVDHDALAPIGRGDQVERAVAVQVGQPAAVVDEVRVQAERGREGAVAVVEVHLHGVAADPVHADDILVAVGVDVTHGHARGRQLGRDGDRGQEAARTLEPALKTLAQIKVAMHVGCPF